MNNETMMRVRREASRMAYAIRLNVAVRPALLLCMNLNAQSTGHVLRGIGLS
jgi:hypothetical protein